MHEEMLNIPGHKENANQNSPVLKVNLIITVPLWSSVLLGYNRKGEHSVLS
jgi:hypothetical protein